MKAKHRPHKDSGFFRGDMSTIARIHRVTPQYIYMIVAGEREGTPAIHRTIARYRERAAKLMATREVAA